MTKSMWILAGRIAFGIIITAICIFILGKISLRWVRFGIYLGTFIIVSYDKSLNNVSRYLSLVSQILP